MPYVTTEDWGRNGIIPGPLVAAQQAKQQRLCVPILYLAPHIRSDHSGNYLIYLANLSAFDQMLTTLEEIFRQKKTARNAIVALL